MGNIHINDIGTKFEVTIKDNELIVDISDATTKEIIFKKPDDSVLTKPASFTTDGIDGKMEYSVVSGDLNVSGLWKLQVRIVTPSGEWKTDITDFPVVDNL